jgi:hypothetical protein
MVAPVLLKKDLQRQVLRAAALEKLHGAVEIDVGPRRQLRGVARREAGALELTLSPTLDSIGLVVLPDGCLEGLHAVSSLPLYPFFGGLDVADLPKGGEAATFYEPLTVWADGRPS